MMSVKELIRLGMFNPGICRLVDLEQTKLDELEETFDGLIDLGKLRKKDSPELELEESNERYKLCLKRLDEEETRYQVDIYDKEKLSHPTIPLNLLARRTHRNFEHTIRLYEALKQKYLAV